MILFYLFFFALFGVLLHESDVKVGRQTGTRLSSVHLTHSLVQKGKVGSVSFFFERERDESFTPIECPSPILLGFFGADRVW